MNKKLSRLLAPSLGLYLLCLVLFAAASAFFSVPLAVIEGVLVVILFLYLRRSSSARKREMLRYIESVTSNMNMASRDTMLSSPLPMVIFHPETDEVVWSNERFLQLTDAREHLFDTKLSASVPDFDARWLLEGKTECPKEVCIGEGRFLVFGSLVHNEDKSNKAQSLATTYWVEITDYSAARQDYSASRPVVAILLLDNYEDAVKGADESARTELLSEINKRLAAWVAPTGGIFSRYDRDRYIFIFEEQYLPLFSENKFSILDAMHEIPSPTKVPATLSIGVGKDAPSLKELFEYASLSLEMALSRGGDQAVVKNKFNFEFYGGRSKETEKRTKVKSRVMANALGELMVDSSRVFVMGHKFPDLDCIGATVGVCAMARKRGARVSIIREPGDNPAAAMTAKLALLPQYENAFISAQDAIVLADPQSLLVIVDTNRPEQALSQDLLECCNRVAVIDHHRRAATYISNAALNFHEPYASSASELVTELLQYLMEPTELDKTEAEALLAGMVLDTKQFSMRTGSRTFEAAAFLRRAGADTSDVRKLFQNDLAGTIARYDIIRKAVLVHGDIAVAALTQTVGRVTAAQAADELLNISGIDASFVLFPGQNDQMVYISARSMGETNVQVVLEKLGGGGNAATAGAQVAGKTVTEVSHMLEASIAAYFEDDKPR